MKKRGVTKKFVSGGSLEFEGLRQQILRTEILIGGPIGGGGRPRAVVLYCGPYEEAMASLSVHVLLELFAGAGWDVERAFHFPEFSGPVRTIESGTPIGDADILLVTVPFELHFVTLIQMLADSGIPPDGDSRGPRHPLVVCGGPAPTANPAPWAAVADWIYVGELEEAFDALAQALAAAVDGAPIAGVPGLVDCQRIRSGEEWEVRRQVFSEVDGFVPRSKYVPAGNGFLSGGLVEVARGCPFACRFCLARAIYHPHRPRSAEAIEYAFREMADAGVRRVGLIAPSFASHPDAVRLLDMVQGLGIQPSAPSLRADVLLRKPELLEALRKSGQRTITVAPEAASERLRRKIGKPLSDDDLVQLVELARRHDFEQVKLYFMVGLPGETSEDIAAFDELFGQLSEAGGPRLELSASVACFVPKAHTPFEGEEMASISYLRRSIAAVTEFGARHGVKVSAESPRLAQAQAAMARGNVVLGLALSKYAATLTAATLVSVARREGVAADELATRGAEDRPWKRVVCGLHS